MDSTLKDSVPLYLGGDLTDRYAKACRDVDVCGLTPGENNKLTASFWFWQWDAAPAPLDVTVIAKELTATRAAMLDGPQGLASNGEALRACERQAACVGKTPDKRPSLGKLFAGFICSSLDLFAALRRAGTNISPPGFLGGVCEVYPAHIWRILADRVLPRKSTCEGRLARKYILEALGVSGLPEPPTHDQNDACVAAVLAAAADGAVPGITARGIGPPLCADPDDTLREGLMVIPEVSAETRELISEALRKTSIIDIARHDAVAAASLDSGTTNDCAKGLLDWLIAKALEGNPRVCTYSWAYRHLFNRSYDKFAQAYAKQVIEVARRTNLRELPGLGAVRLDAFVVAKDSGLPSGGHWQSAQYDREDWERVLGTAMVLHEGGIGMTQGSVLVRSESSSTAYQPIRAPRGSRISCKGWPQEAALRMLMNNLDEEVAERPQELIIYGGTGKAARNWDCYHAIVEALKKLENDETLLVQSGKPVGVFRTHAWAPRVLIANANLVGHWATWEKFRELERLGLMMYGQMTAGSWIYIGTQGILQGTFETFAAASRKHFGGDLSGKLVVSGGMGGMGGAQPLAATMNGAAFLGVEVDAEKIKRRIRGGYCDICVNDLDEALRILKNAVRQKQAVSVGLVGNCAEVIPELARRGVVPDLLTDQTSAHDPLNGYIPSGLTLEEACELRRKYPDDYLKRSYESIAHHVTGMLELQKLGSATFDYGNNIRTMAFEHGGVKDAYNFPGFVPAYIRPLFCEGRGPFRWAALSGEATDIYRTDDLVLELFPDNPILDRWIRLAHKYVKFQGLPARICWLGYGERALFGERINDLVAKGELKAPIVIGRDHLDCGSVASPFRETEGMKDGSDAIADWPVLNALLNTASGASWVSFHHGGGVGIGYSLHAGQVTVADGTAEMAKRLNRVLTNDPGIGVARHVDAGYEEAVAFARKSAIKIPAVG